MHFGALNMVSSHNSIFSRYLQPSVLSIFLEYLKTYDFYYDNCDKSHKVQSETWIGGLWIKTWKHEFTFTVLVFFCYCGIISFDFSE